MTVAGLLAIALVGLAVSSTRTGSRELIMALRATAVVLCVGAAFTLDDPAATSMAATPTSLLRRRLLRGTLATVAVAVPWGVSLYLVANRDDSLPLPALTLEGVTLLASTLALVAVVARITGLDSPGSATASLLLVLVAASLLLPGGWSPWSPEPGAGFDRDQRWWTVALVLSQACFVWATREPYPRLGPCLRRLVRGRGAGPWPAAGHDPVARGRR